MTYRGSCHCGAVRFAFQSDEITSALRCNCSICIRRNSVMSERWYPLEEFTGKESLALYQWGDHEVNFWFCKTCGVHPFAEVTAKPGAYRVNLGCVEGVDTYALPLRLVDGKSFPVTRSR
jgi:hypothetical protein